MKAVVIKSIVLGSHPVEDIGAEASKVMSPGTRYRYKLRGRYILEDGREIAALFRAMTRPKLQERVASTERHVAAGAMKAEFSDNGEYWGTSTTFGL